MTPGEVVDVDEDALMTLQVLADVINFVQMVSPAAAEVTTIAPLVGKRQIVLDHRVQHLKSIGRLYLIGGGNKT